MSIKNLLVKALLVAALCAAVANAQDTDCTTAECIRDAQECAMRLSENIDKASACSSVGIDSNNACPDACKEWLEIVVESCRDVYAQTGLTAADFEGYDEYCGTNLGEILGGADASPSSPTPSGGSSPSPTGTSPSPSGSGATPTSPAPPASAAAPVKAALALFAGVLAALAAF